MMPMLTIDALAVMPDNAQVIDGAKRVAKRLGMNEDLVQLEKRYGKASFNSEKQSHSFRRAGRSRCFARLRQTLPLMTVVGTALCIPSRFLITLNK